VAAGTDDSAGDAGCGDRGKTGLDTPKGKNLIGAFHQPVAVLMDPAVLVSLPASEMRTGLAEAVKHAAILDPVHFAWLGAAVAPVLAREPRTIESLLRRNVGHQGRGGPADEHENGRRAILNAGHTIGHAVEQASGYSVTHGESVAIGLVLEARMGERLGVTERGTAGEIAELLERLGLPVRAPAGLSIDLVDGGDPERQEESREHDQVDPALSSRDRVRQRSSRDGQWRCPRRCCGRCSPPESDCAVPARSKRIRAQVSVPSTKMLISIVVESLQKIDKSHCAREFRCGC
jgi:hypothetical protein